MSYVPNAADPTQPTEDKKVESAALEFRTLKLQEVRGVRFPAADAPANRGELPAAASRAGRFLAFDAVTGVPIPGPLLSAWTITQAQITAIETVATNIASVNTVATNIAAILTAVADLPALAGKVSQTGGTASAVIPAGTSAQRDVAPVAGYFRFNQTLNQFEGYNGTQWGEVGAGASGAPNNPILYMVDQVATGNFTVPANKFAFRPGPFTINSGVEITIQSGGSLIVVN